MPSWRIRSPRAACHGIRQQSMCTDTLEVLMSEVTRVQPRGAEAPALRMVLLTLLFVLPLCFRAGWASAGTGIDTSRVTISAENADLAGVVVAIAKQAGLDVVVDQDVRGSVTAVVTGRGLSEALQHLLDGHGYAFEIEGGLLRVYGHALETRVFRLDYVTGIRSGSSVLSASSGRTEEGSAEGGPASGFQGGESSVSVSSTMAADVWGEVVRGLQGILFDAVVEEGGSEAEQSDSQATAYSGSDGSRLVVNPISGVIIVTSTHQKLQQAAEFLEAIKEALCREVLIEAKVLEVALSEECHHGIDWSRIPGAGDILDISGKDDVAVTQRLSPQNGLFQVAVSYGDFDAVIDALSRQGRVEVLSSPRVVTLNNQKAIIKVAREQSFFSQRIDYESNPNGSSEPILSVEPQRVTIGLVLDVTPQVSPEGEVTLSIHPAITELAGEDVFPPGATSTEIIANAPVLDIREIDAVVRVKDGHMLIIGGLIKKNRTVKETGVPLLCKIPILGYLFKQRHEVEERVELVIMVRPSLLEPAAADREAREVLNRMGNVSGGSG